MVETLRKLRRKLGSNERHTERVFRKLLDKLRNTGTQVDGNLCRVQHTIAVVAETVRQRARTSSQVGISRTAPRRILLRYISSQSPTHTDIETE